MHSMSMDEFNRNKVQASSKHVNNENNEKKEGLSSLRSIICDYGERTTVHGLRYLILGKSVFRKLIWFCFIFSAFLYFISNGVRLFTNFFDYPTMTKNEIIKQQKMLFPAITICNYNAIRKHKFEIALRLGNWKDKINGNLSDHKEKITDGAKVPNDIETLYKYFGHAMDEHGMFVSCKWKGKFCRSSDFRSSVQSMGLCHTFNSGHEGYPLQYLTSPGETNGLLLTLNVQIHEYQKHTESVGIKVLIHDQNEPIFIKEGGFAVMPGRKALVSVTKKELITSPPPYGTPCDTNAKHSKTLCLSNCKEQYIIDHCNCQIPPPTRNNVKICSEKELDNCYTPYEAKYHEEDMGKNCSCLDSCETKTYETDLSYAYFTGIPNTSSLHDQFNQYNTALLQRKLSSAGWREYLRENILQLAIYFNDLSYIRTENVPAYSWESFMAEFGGTLGLFLGASFLTITEILDLICHITAFLFGRKPHQSVENMK